MGFFIFLGIVVIGKIIVGLKYGTQPDKDSKPIIQINLPK